VLHHIRETERMHQISAAVVGIHDMVKFCKIQQQHTLSDNKVSNMFSKHATTGQQYAVSFCSRYCQLPYK